VTEVAGGSGCGRSGEMRDQVMLRPVPLPLPLWVWQWQCGSGGVAVCEW
jgi:hypothetical protein